MPARRHMERAEALREFNKYVRPAILKKYGKDRPALSEAWNVFIDQLHRDKLISDKQVNGWSNPFYK